MAKPQGLLSPLERQTYESFGIAPREDRLSLLPRYSAKTGLIAPQFIYDAAKALAAPYTAAQGYDLPPEEAVNVGMNMMGGSFVGSAPKGALRSGISKDIKPLSNAEKLGFTKDAYHFSKTGADIKEFVPGMQDLSPFGIGTHVGTKEAALDRFLKTTQTGATYPLKIKTERQFLNKEGNPFSEEQLSSELRKLAQKIGDDKGIDIEKLPYKEKNQILSEYMWKKYDAIPYINDVEAPGSVSYIVPSQNIRSRFAQFDPTKVGSKDILAGVVPLGLIAEDDKKQKKDMRK
jgi:hypothetical protein